MMSLFASLGSNPALSTVIKVGTGIVTVLFVVPALIRLFVVTVDEGWAAIRTRNGKPIIRKRAMAKRYRFGAKKGQIRELASPLGEVVVLHPGSHAAFPLFYWFKLIDVRTRSRDLPARTLTSSTGHQYIVHASIEWRPVASGRDLRVFELDVTNVEERIANIVGAALRDVVRNLGAPPLPANAEISELVLSECRALVLEDCGVALQRVTLTGDALTEGFVLAEAIRERTSDTLVVPVLH